MCKTRAPHQTAPLQVAPGLLQPKCCSFCHSHRLASYVHIHRCAIVLDPLLHNTDDVLSLRWAEGLRIEGSTQRGEDNYMQHPQQQSSSSSTAGASEAGDGRACGLLLLRSRITTSLQASRGEEVLVGDGSLAVRLIALPSSNASCGWLAVPILQTPIPHKHT